MSLALRIAKVRDDSRRCTRLIAHARRLYFTFCWPDIRDDKTNTTLNYCAKRLIASGLYCTPLSQLRLVRYAILRHAWKQETSGSWRQTGTNSWSRWLARNGFVVHEFERRDIREVA